jgi:predicted acyltransferase (DUF342 family)
MRNERASREPDGPDPVDQPDLPETGLWPCEAEMLDRAESGELLDRGSGPLDPEGMQAWGQDRTIRTSVLRRLIVGDEWPVHAKGVQLRGVKISGRLDLESATLRCPLYLDHCYFDGSQPVLDYATVSLLAFTGCVLAGLTANTLTVTQDLSLARSLFSGPVSLGGAQITGSLSCAGARLEGTDADGDALIADNLKVGRDLFLRNGFAAAGAIRLAGADITGNLDCDDARLAGANAGGNALVAGNLKVGRNALLRNGFAAAGAIWLAGADITGNLDCDEAKLNRANAQGLALIAEQLRVGGEVCLRGKFAAAGAISLLGADITGDLDCSGAELNGANANGTALIADTLKVGRNALLRDGFTTAGAISLIGASIAGNLECDGAQLNGADRNGNALVADALTVGHDVFLRNGFTAAGGISLLGVSITGNLECSGAQLNGADGGGNALVADNLKVGGDLFLDEDFTAAGGVSLLGANITGNLDCGGAKLAGADTSGNAMVADGLTIGHDALLRNGFTAAGAISLVGADITGNLDCEGAKLQGANPAGYALVADNLRVRRSALLRNGFTAAGAISLLGADITGNLECDDAKLERANAKHQALVAEQLKVGGQALLRNGFTAAGAIWLLGADITGNLECDGAKLNGSDESSNALIADNLRVGGDLFLRNGFTGAGAIRLVGADITGNLDCNAAELTGASEGNALVADGLKVGHDVLLGRGFTAAGAISLESACINGSLSASMKKLPDAAAELAFHAPGMQITHELRWMPTEAFTGPVNLEDAQVGQLRDDWAGARGSANGYWPSGGLLRLDGFRYARLGGDHQATAKQRLSWIQSQYLRTAAPGRERRFATQPYEQLANVYQQGGQDKEARIIALARRRDIRRYGDLTWYRNTLNWLLDRSIQYGYQTWRAVLALALVYVAAVVIFWTAQHHANLIVPVMNAGSGPAPAAMHCTSGYPCFYPAGYAIDVVIPIINVHQASFWGPNGDAPWGDALTVFTWLGTAVGWALATLAVAGYTGLVRSSDTL